MARKSVNTTLDSELYSQIQMIALQQSIEKNEKINANDLLEEGMRYIVEKYGSTKS
ncbi:hypothetical protein P4H39_32100 [Paenibacillus lautus]|jgi:hypothetical protein|uniref:hypothetical protein n=1 Tax=Paenibacillus lautus TaxID=1401 RepID=UPI0010ECC787|nr:hypothetical protein [Paenibacillus lautus]MBX4152312.1 hypothetical protein [Paenibacillus lautus]MEC0207255.1 hypothetical protein [Paenibacillus lautus]VTR24329.1 Uncharacterised protein [Actinobacillus pleuropneumoniae]VTR24399.1 Uncharacterised protein [Actinobacillus pleuropneumoniae]